MIATTTTTETRVLIENISWQTFKTMLAEMGCNRNTRFAYNNGSIEIMTPQMPNENSNRLIEGLVIVLCEELGLEVKHAGSLTLTQDDIESGAQPDSSYDIRNESFLRRKQKIDLAFDPLPDLVLS